MTFSLAERVVTVAYDPRKVRAEAVKKAVEDANAKLGHDDAPATDVGLLLGEEPPEENP